LTVVKAYSSSIVNNFDLFSQKIVVGGQGNAIVANLLTFKINFYFLLNLHFIGPYLNLPCISL